MKGLIILKHLIIVLPQNYGNKIRVEFNVSCLKQDKITYNHGTIVNIYIVYEISKNCNISSYPTFENCFFEAVSLTKYTNIDQYKYSGYNTDFSRNDEFSFGDGYGKKVILLGADTGSSRHATNKTQSILIFGDDFTQGLAGTIIYVEKLYSINFTEKELQWR